MFKELAPLLRQRSVLLTLTRLDDDNIRVNVFPKKLNESENNALTTPMTLDGTAEDLDARLPSELVGFVGAHLGLKSTLDSAKEQMEAAAKAAKAEAKKPATKTELSKSQPTRVVTPEPAKPAVEKKAAVPRTESLFDMPATPPQAILIPIPQPAINLRSDDEDEIDEEQDIMAEISDCSEVDDYVGDAA